MPACQQQVAGSVPRGVLTYGVHVEGGHVIIFGSEDSRRINEWFYAVGVCVSHPSRAAAWALRSCTDFGNFLTHFPRGELAVSVTRREHVVVPPTRAPRPRRGARCPPAPPKDFFSVILSQHNTHICVLDCMFLLLNQSSAYS